MSFVNYVKMKFMEFEEFDQSPILAIDDTRPLSRHQLDDLEDEDLLAEVDQILAESAAMRVGGPLEAGAAHHEL